MKKMVNENQKQGYEDVDILTGRRKVKIVGGAMDDVFGNPAVAEYVEEED